MNNFKLLTQEQLKDPVVAEKIKKLAGDIIRHMMTKEAYNLFLNLEKSLAAVNLKTAFPKLAQEYERLVIQLKLTALPMLNNEETVRVIKEHFLESLEVNIFNGFKVNIDIENRLTAKLFSIPLTPRDDLRQGLQSAVQNNQQKIGALTISQWISDYNNFSHPDQRTNISPREYLLSSRQVSGLSEEDKNKLYTLFHVYDHLLLVTPVMSEEEMREIIGSPARSPVQKPMPTKPEKQALPLTAQPHPLPPLPVRPPMPPSTQPPPPLSSAYESRRTIRLRDDRYLEPIEEMSRPKQTEPRIEGNVVDLKSR